MTSAITEAVNAGVVVVAATGNGRWEEAGGFTVYRPGDNFSLDGIEAGVNNKPVLYPAALDNVLAVGAVMKEAGGYAVSNFSCSGPEVDVVAPGTGILSTDYVGNGTQPMSGTSMAAPHVAALAALLKVQDASRTPPGS